MHINEEKELIDINDHCLVRTWFNVGKKQKNNWKNPEFKMVEWIKRDSDTLEKMVEDLLPNLRNKVIF